MVSLVLFHRFTLVACVISWFIQSRMFLLMMPISVLHGLMSLQVELFMKSGLWSFSVTYIHTYIHTLTLFTCQEYLPNEDNWGH